MSSFTGYDYNLRSRDAKITDNVGAYEYNYVVHTYIWSTRLGRHCRVRLTKHNGFLRYICTGTDFSANACKLASRALCLKTA
ncbi:hypothetical protein ACRALDRAFT_1059675 [Sodiomyces alcalophilus JCM 7366]|uniref:uncharacterized protein n=1 Tax=Sodiomyces alcalophilus JCM 7366 TaxID=591952 RepID=UPI0039B399B4